jgi:hypothetical protein
MTDLTITCLCGRARQTVTTDEGSDILTLCHCTICRHATGQLAASFRAINKPTDAGLKAVAEYRSSTSTTRFFCSTCGCHIFRGQRNPSGYGDVWGVATGTIVAESGPSEGDSTALTIRHMHAADTVDGGLATFLGNAAEDAVPATTTASPPPNQSSRDVHLQASCHCDLVAFHITAPSAASLEPTSNYADCLISYCSTPASVYTNPSNVKWWLRDPSTTSPTAGAAAITPSTRYLAGTCACRSCRLASGFEIQSWGFVPAANILFTLPGAPSPKPLSFSALHGAGVLRAYGSSEGVVREFCPRCGATVFWHGDFRPMLIDVSMGLLRGDGARAEGWFSWWKERCSFAEEAGRGREGLAARRAEELVERLEMGLREDGQQQSKLAD